jgi:hypothetical protein
MSSHVQWECHDIGIDLARSMAHAQQPALRERVLCNQASSGRRLQAKAMNACGARGRAS